jgi:predicted MPP superfamily phosphohydrolase
MNLELAEDDMRVGDYVAKITNEWQKHNRWMEFPDEKPKPLGIIVSAGAHSLSGTSWCVLQTCGAIIDIGENQLKVINETK